MLKVVGHPVLGQRFVMHRVGTASTSRRRLLAAAGSGALAAASGCTGTLRSMTGWRPPEQVSLDVKTVPVDTDENAIRIARLLADWFGTVGIDTTVTPMSEQELLRQVLLNHEFDVFVFRSPSRFRNPDALYSLLHSQFAAAPGWQNPFGFADLDVDDLLDAQRRTSGARRARHLADLQRAIVRSNPFTVVAFPDDVRAARDDHFTGWRDVDLDAPTGYLRLERADGSGDVAADDTLRVVVTDGRATKNLNPLAVEYRGAGVMTGLLYEPLGYRTDVNEVAPWLASSWDLRDGDGGPTARVELRDDLTWHDGASLTATDVAFTYRFLADTSLDAADTEEHDPVPAPSYQGRSSLVSTVDVVDDRTVDVRFHDCDPQVARRAFTVPVLPEHVWAARNGRVSLAGIEIGTATEALVTDNVPPVGSGPFAFVENEPNETLVLERNPAHFLTRDEPSRPESFPVEPAFERLSLQVVGSDSTAVQVVADGEADVTGTSVGPRSVPGIGRAPELDLLVDRADGFYFVGYNVRRPPLTNPRFRNALAHLLDKGFVAEEVFQGYARPAASALDGTMWLPDDLVWESGDPATPFRGVDGELDLASAREELRDAGYRYDDGHLVEA